MYLKCVLIWATSRENLFLPYANNKDADQPAHPRSLISIFIVHCLDSIIPMLATSKISRLSLASVAAQDGLSLPWLQTEDRFSHDKAPITVLYYRNDPKFLDRQVLANSADPDQTAPRGGLHCLQIQPQPLDPLSCSKTKLFQC